MGDLQATRKRFWTAAVGLGIVNVALLAYLLWPGSSASAQEAQEASLQQRANTLRTEVEKRKKSNPEKIRDDLKTFYAQNIPQRSSQISEQIEKIVKETGVTAPAISFSPEASDKGGLPFLQKIKVETTVSGDYNKVAHFINALEQAKLLFIVDKVSLTGQEGGSVTLQISFTPFLKETA